ncbi:NAD(P)-binding protein [Streptomyces sp. LHD-70]|uniref:FAD-dependent oxidoreductase n=1 Tax=Streptomyces sp. LHD-70 TaxID=3072140 RepID=UPI00280F0071|nr:FAD-dependent oxidoreductase [Streptomyces sp. LHD-70]MDQ8706106.1 NAD(P)-binding protein [Streptomyces sp. LHD-70]
MSTYFVVGAGPSGLGCALALAQGTNAHVVLVDRIPVTGGETGWDEPHVQKLTAQAEAAGVELRLGAIAMRWQDRRLLLVSPLGVEWLSGDRLFYAGGRRPATQADLGITGQRPAGVLPATVVEHLLTSGVALWQRPLIVGHDTWAARLAVELRHGGGTILGLGNVDWADERFPDGRIEVLGTHRVEGVRVHNGADVTGITCDGIVLAADARPNRNVEGALFDDADGVTFVQPLTVDGATDRATEGAAAAKAWIHSQGETA